MAQSLRRHPGKGRAILPLPKGRILTPLKGRETLPLPTTVKLQTPRFSIMNSVGAGSSCPVQHCRLSSTTRLPMRKLLQLIDPRQFEISLSYLATYLGITQDCILRFEQWANVLFVHRKDRGGQFISYRNLIQWLEACVQAIRTCESHQALKELGQLLKTELQRFTYAPDAIAYLRRLWQQRKAQLDLDLNLRSFYTPIPISNP
ncbi:hypothetical protein H6F94_12600 [Leptolyngbya sp. FACHB-261]|nr:hypothetical protein [Leptolyngbya sp. FACHB-261]